MGSQCFFLMTPFIHDSSRKCPRRRWHWIAPVQPWSLNDLHVVSSPPCLCLCPSHGPSLCCCALFLTDFLSLFCSLPPLLITHFINYWQHNPKFSPAKEPVIFDLTPVTIFSVWMNLKKSGKAPRYFLFVVSRDVLYVTCQFCAKCITTQICKS